jgi:HlyD family secretion protein
VAQGEVLFRLDPSAQQAAVDQADQAIITAEATLANLKSGKRPAELNVLRAQRDEAQASLILAKHELQRASALLSSGAAAQARFDAATAQVAQVEARIAQIDANLQVAELGGREQEIAAAVSRVAEARAAAAAARVKLADLAPAAPIAAQVEDTFFDAGEWVAAGQPVVSLLSPQQLTLRFYVPETMLAKAQPGVIVRYACDGCQGQGEATITRVAATPEYTPPVIYSQGARAKLVYLVEAKPNAAAPALRPGLPIAVVPLP